MACTLLDFYGTPEFEIMGVGNMDGSFSLPEILEMELESVGWSQRRLASTSGLSSGVISDIIRGKSGLSGRSVACLSASLGLAPDVLIAADSATKISDICEEILVSDHFDTQTNALKRFIDARSLIPHHDVNRFTHRIISRNLWKTCPNVIDQYQDVFSGALAVMSADYRGEYFWARLETMGIEREYLFDVTFQTCPTIPIRVAQMLAEAGIGTMYAWLVMSLKATTMRYMIAHHYELTSLLRTVDL